VLSAVEGLTVANPGLGPEMGRRGREFVLEHLDARKQTRRLADLYAALVSGDRQALRPSHV
jgi:hypothetical protein